MLCSCVLEYIKYAIFFVVWINSHTFVKINNSLCMKKVVYILSCISLFLSCSDKDVYKAPETDLNLLKPYEDMEVVVPEGYASIVKLYDDTLAICSYSTCVKYLAGCGF